MTREEFGKLKRGEIIQNKGSGNSYLVSSSIHMNNGDIYHFLVRSVTAENPDEWEIVDKE